MRRWVALVLALAMLHLSAARAHAVCVTPAPVAQHDAAPDDAHHAGHSAHQPASHESAPSETDGVPVDPGCCAAMHVCTTSFVDDAGERAAAAAMTHARIVEGSATMPSSGIRAPEPPPPRR